nr:hypothetical protein [Tanacetum cinerariifolium]
MVRKKKQYLSTHDKKENKRKRPAIANHSDYEDSIVMKKKETDNTNEPKKIVTRMSTRSLKRVLETLTPVQQKKLSLAEPVFDSSRGAS